MSAASNDVTECRICLRSLPKLFLIDSMCCRCAQKEKDRTKADGKIRTKADGKSIDTATTKAALACPWCKDPIGAANADLHFNECASCPKDAATALRSYDRNRQRGWVQQGVWFGLVSVILLEAGVDTTPLNKPSADP